MHISQADILQIPDEAAGVTVALTPDEAKRLALPIAIVRHAFLRHEHVWLPQAYPGSGVWVWTTVPIPACCCIDERQVYKVRRPVDASNRLVTTKSPGKPRMKARSLTDYKNPWLDVAYHARPSELERRGLMTHDPDIAPPGYPASGHERMRQTGQALGTTYNAGTAAETYHSRVLAAMSAKEAAQRRADDWTRVAAAQRRWRMKKAAEKLVASWGLHPVAAE